jgi:hypothetical protein
VELGAVAVTGLFVRAVQEPAWWRLVLTSAAAGFVALVRPIDSVLVMAPIFAISLVVTRLRRLTVLAAVAIGELIGWLPWVIEGTCGSVVQSKGFAETSGPGGLNLRSSNLQAEGVFVLALLSGAPPPGSYLSSWQQVRIPGLARRFQVYIPPA